MQKSLLLFFVLLSFQLQSQNLKGIVYDAETTVKGALVVNVTENALTYTNDKGEFQIAANVQDTIYVSSLFHTKSLFVLKAKDFEDIMVIEVKKAVNELDEVFLRDEREKKFDSVAMESQLRDQIKEDIKRNPGAYGLAPVSGNMDFIAIGRMIGRLFRSKKKKESVPSHPPLNYKSIDSLFRTDRFFNPTLLTVDLNIPEVYHSLFFEYCETKLINSKLLFDKKRVDLLETFVTCSQEFQVMIEEAKKDP